MNACLGSNKAPMFVTVRYLSKFQYQLFMYNSPLSYPTLSGFIAIDFFQTILYYLCNQVNPNELNWYYFYFFILGEWLRKKVQCCS